MERMVRHMFPYYVAALVVLALITYVPEVVLFLPCCFIWPSAWRRAAERPSRLAGRSSVTTQGGDR